jgi:YesN/AraC family two-component response regulator
VEVLQLPRPCPVISIGKTSPCQQANQRTRQPVSSSDVAQDDSAPFVHRIDEAFAQCCAQNSENIADVCSALFEDSTEANVPIHTILEICMMSVEHAAAFLENHAHLALSKEEYRTEIEQAPTYELLKTQFCHSMQQLFLLFDRVGNRRLQSPYASPKSIWLSTTTMEMLSLEGVSEIVHLNSSYFSALFKRASDKALPNMYWIFVSRRPRNFI